MYLCYVLAYFPLYTPAIGILLPWQRSGCTLVRQCCWCFTALAKRWLLYCARSCQQASQIHMYMYSTPKVSKIHKYIELL